MNKIIAIKSDLVIIRFNENPMIGKIARTDNNSYFIIQKITDNNAVASIIEINEELKIGTTIKICSHGIVGPVGQNIYGEVFNVLGQSTISAKKFKLIEQSTNNHNSIVDSHNLIETGIKAIDFFTPIFKGNKLGVFGGAGVGKTVVIKEIIFNSSKQKEDYKAIFVGIGERSREGEELYRELEESNLLNQTVLFFAGMNEYAGARFNIINSALITAEYLRDNENKNIIMFVDNIYRYLQAGNELSSSLERKPSAVGYQPTLMSEISEVEERIVQTQNGSITSFQSVYIPADDITDPAATAIFSHLDGSIVLDRKIASENIYPAISILDSVSSNTTLEKIGKTHYDALKKVKMIVKRAEELEDIISILGIGELSQEDQEIVKISQQIQYYFTQNFHVAEHFTQKEGVFVSLEQTIMEVKQIVNKKFLNVDPQKFLYIKNLEHIEENIKQKQGEVNNE